MGSSIWSLSFLVLARACMKKLARLILLLFFSTVVIMGFLFTISAATTVNFVTSAGANLANSSNLFGSAYTLVAYVNGTPADSNVGNVTFYYQPWIYVAAANGTWITIATVENTTANQTVFSTTWNTTALTDFKNYSLNITAFNYTYGAINATNFSSNMTIDNTPPITAIYTGATLTAYTNLTIKTATTQNLTLNISVSDATVGLLNTSASYCFINANGTNQTIPLYNGFCNSSIIRLTDLSDGNHPIMIYVNDTIGNKRLNNTLYVQLDTTPPTIILAPYYTNATARKNTSTLTLNISVSDATSGLTGSACKINVDDGTNQTVGVSSGWCNTTEIDMTGLTDNNYTINVYVNDTGNLLKLNNSFVVWADTTVPSSVTATCSPSTVQTGDTFPCTCTGTDAGSGINSTATTASSTSNSITSTSNTGTFTYNCTVTDYAGNFLSSTAVYSVTLSGGSSGGGGSSTTTWITQIVTDTVFEQGYTTQLPTNNRVKVKVDSQDHYVGVLLISGTKATIQISSIPIQVTLSAGQNATADVNDDGFYDIYILLNGIVNNKADISIQKIHQAIPEGESSITTTGETSEGAGEETTTITEESGGSLLWLWIAIALVIIIAIGWGIGKSKKK